MNDTWHQADVVEHYSQAKELQCCESYLFEKYLTDAPLLDVGVGGGRTTRYLLPKVSRYLGVDYSMAMVEACTKAFPETTFLCADASDLSFLKDGEFDQVVFSFNGIGCIPDDSARQRCLSEFHRVLRPGGRLIFSVHNSRRLFQLPLLHNTSWLRGVWRTGLALAKTFWLIRMALTKKVFLSGHGYIWDPTHGGFRVYQATPSVIQNELLAAGFRLTEVVGANYPSSFSSFTEPWFYYSALKPAADA